MDHWSIFVYGFTTGYVVCFFVYTAILKYHQRTKK